MNPQTEAILETVTAWMQMIVLAASVITLAVTAARTAARPNKTQNGRLDAIESWQKAVDAKLRSGSVHFDELDEGNRVTQVALLALLSHAIDGNDTARLKDAKTKLESYLIEK